jgi:hypothetical protein
VTAPSTASSPGAPEATAAAARLREFRELRARGALCSAVTDELATEAATRFLEEFRATGTYLRDAVTLLAEISALEEPCLSDPGQRATFPLLVEKLSDSFDPALCALYDRAFAQMISSVRGLPSGARVDAALRHFGIHSEKDLLDRKSRIAALPPWCERAQQRGRVRKVLALSRVTLGADVALTSIVLQKSQSRFPNAERVLLAPGKARELFGGDDSLRIREAAYASGGSLVERLESWVGIVEAVGEEIRGLKLSEYVLLDPDSRYLQLGLLPALPDESSYLFFESRVIGGSQLAPLGQLLTGWLTDQVGGQETILPRVWLRHQDQEFGGRIARRLRAGGAQGITAMSFGVGGNAEKRLDDPFEQQLVARLLAEGGTLILDQGAGEEERQRALRLVEFVRNSGYAVAEIDGVFSSALTANPPLECRLLTWRGGIGAWSGLIGASDSFIGYDSAGQHIAAALGIPSLDIFSAGAAPVFRERWKPGGPAMVRVVAAKPESGSGDALDAAIDDVIRASREIREKIRGR